MFAPCIQFVTKWIITLLNEKLQDSCKEWSSTVSESKGSLCRNRNTPELDSNPKKTNTLCQNSACPSSPL